VAEFGWVLWLTTSLVLAAPVVLAAMGGLTSERSGIMNIALEGKMLTAACVTALVANATGSAVVGLAAGVTASLLLSLLLGLLAQAYRMDHIVAGMAINALALGGTRFLHQRFTDPDRAAEMAKLPIELYFGLALLAPFVVALVLVRTRGGLRLLAVGSDPEKSRQAGLRPAPIRYGALSATGLLCGLAGAMLVTNAGGFSDGMTAGKGFIALAAVVLGGWRPLPTLAACLAFGLIDGFQLQVQGSRLVGSGIPSEFWNALPYLATVLAMAFLGGRTRAPAGLGRP